MKKSTALKALGLAEGATDEEIKQAHRKLVIKNHPDNFGQDAARREEAEEKTKLINEARDVLLNGTWEPEYGTYGTPYGAPFSYNPYTASTGYGSASNNTGGARSGYAGSTGGTSGAGTAPGASGANPFAGWPFSETFVWTTWDAQGQSQGQTHTYSTTSTGTGGAGSAPGFDSVFFDFSAFIPKAPSASELLARAKRNLATELKIIGVKLVILLVSFLLSAPATGLYLYTILSIGQGIWKRLHFLSLIFLVPFAMLALIFTPGANAAVGITAIVVFVFAVIFDVRNIILRSRRVYQLSQQAKS